jgi:hypothetical protein
LRFLPMQRVQALGRVDIAFGPRTEQQAIE